MMLMINKYRVVVAYLSASILSACQTTPQKSVENPVEAKTKASDVVMMPSLASGSKVNPSYQLKTMTLDELKGCAENLYDIKTASAALKTQNAALTKRQTTLSDTEQSLIDRRLKIDTRNTKLVNEFNQEGNEYMENVKQLQVDISSYNNQVDKANQKNNAYNINCNNRAYKASDLQQLPPNLMNIMQNNSESLDIQVLENPAPGSESNSVDTSKIHLPGSSRK